MSLSHRRDRKNNWASGAQKAKDNTDYSLYTSIQNGLEIVLNLNLGSRGTIPNMGWMTRFGETMKADGRCTLIKSTLVHCAMRPISHPFRIQTPHKQLSYCLFAVFATFLGRRNSQNIIPNLAKNSVFFLLICKFRS